MTTPSRRTFLKVASSAVAAAALPSWVPAAGPRPQRGGISLGHSLYGMQTVPLTEAVAHCARLGFKNVELTLDPGTPADPRTFSKTARHALRTQLKSEGLTVSALMRNLRLIEGTMTSAQNVEALKEAAELAHDLSPDAPPPIETVLGGKPDRWEVSKATMAGALAEWTKAVESLQVDLLLKAHVFMAVDTPDKLLWLLNQNPSGRVHVAYDYSHFQPQGLTMEATWAALASRTRFIHVKDTRKEGDKLLMVLPGEGGVDYTAFFRMLRRTGYAGPVVAEVSAMVFRQPGYDPLATAEKCYRVLAAALKASAEPPKTSG